MRKYFLNENYFESIDSENKAYWLGFIAADGCVYIDSRKKTRKTLRIELSKKDVEVLEKFKKDLKSEHPVKFWKKRESVSLSITCKKLVNDLINLGIVPKKTFKLNFPNIKKKYYNHFIRGYFDGDGSWHVNDKNYVMFNLSCASDNFRKQLKDILNKDLNLNKNIKENNIALQYCGTRQSKKFYDYIYKNSSLCLTRKKKKVSSILEEYKYKHPHPPSRRVCKFSLDDKFIVKYNGIREASRKTGCDRKGIIKTCQGRQLHCGGYKWRYDD